jgi:hypothetical protein
MTVECAASDVPVSECRRKRGDTPSSKISKITTPSCVVMRCAHHDRVFPAPSYDRADERDESRRRPAAVRSRHSPTDVRKQSGWASIKWIDTGLDTREQLITNQESDHRQNYGAGDPARCWPITAAGRHTCFLRLPQVDQECLDQIRDRWIAAPATANMPISMTTIAGIIPIKPERAHSCSRSEFQRRVADILALRGVWPKWAFLKVSRTRYVYLNNLKLLQSWRICIDSKFK